MDNAAYIDALCHEIKRNGQTPSVGLIRSKSKRKLAVREVIESLKRWKEASPAPNQNLSESTHKAADTTNTSLAQRVEVLETEVLALKELVAKLINNDRC